MLSPPTVQFSETVIVDPETLVTSVPKSKPYPYTKSPTAGVDPPINVRAFDPVEPDAKNAISCPKRFIAIAKATSLAVEANDVLI
jgi:hypothetical protein